MKKTLAALLAVAALTLGGCGSGDDSSDDDAPATGIGGTWSRSRS